MAPDEYSVPVHVGQRLQQFHKPRAISTVRSNTCKRLTSTRCKAVSKRLSSSAVANPTDVPDPQSASRPRISADPLRRASCRARLTPAEAAHSRGSDARSHAPVARVPCAAMPPEMSDADGSMPSNIYIARFFRKDPGQKYRFFEIFSFAPFGTT